MLRIKLGEEHIDNAKMVLNMVKSWRNKVSERSEKRLHHHIQLKKASGNRKPGKNFVHVWLNIPEKDLK